MTAGVQSGWLTLSRAGVSATFKPANAAPSIASALIGPTRKLQSLKHGSVQWHPIPKSPYQSTVTLTATTFQASDGCNSLGQALSFDPTGRMLTFGGAGETSVGACSLAAPGPPPGAFPPRDYLAAFDGTLQASVRGNALDLTGPDGLSLTFSR